MDDDLALEYALNGQIGLLALVVLSVCAACIYNALQEEVFERNKKYWLAALCCTILLILAVLTFTFLFGSSRSYSR